MRVCVSLHHSNQRASCFSNSGRQRRSPSRFTGIAPRLVSVCRRDLAVPWHAPPPFSKFWLPLSQNHSSRLLWVGPTPAARIRCIGRRSSTAWLASRWVFVTCGADAASVDAMVKFDLGLGSARATLPFFFSPSPGIRFSLVNRAAPVPPPHTHFFFFLRTSPCTERCGAEAGPRARNQGGGRAGGGLYLPHPHPLHGCLRYGVQRRAWT